MSVPGYPSVLSFHSSLGEGEVVLTYVCTSLPFVSGFFYLADLFSPTWSVPIARSRFRAGCLTSSKVEGMILAVVRTCLSPDS